ncbi:MAG TPA: prolyl oligopeptidase family serine peptidase [Planctomycetota bacterium]|nr:prolyl oligopeptidase family serine peptidase [Planctomycetota bacterium]
MMLTALLLAFLQGDPVFKPEEQPRKMLYKHLQDECGKAFEARRKDVAALKTADDLRKRQEDLRAKFIQALGGFPEKTPLNAKVVGSVAGDGFRVDKVLYESRPDHHVTGVLYIPEGKGPFPGVLIPCGHSDKGKAEEAYQRISILLAKNGFVVLCYDPIGQGERMQLLAVDGKPAIKGNTTEHTMAGIGALLVGGSCASFRIWDGIRSIDYLASRSEVDPKRLGCTGNSGGGTMTAYLMALDERIACAAPSCYVTTLERLFATIGPQDAEQNITGQVAFGMEHTDYVTMRAPRPTLICTGTQDYFDIQGAWTTFRESKQVYAMIGHAERVDLIEVNDKHGFSQPRREAALRWMRRWLQGVDDAAVETPSPVFKEEELRCTASGQVLAEFKGRSVFDLNLERAKELEAKRGRVDASRIPPLAPLDTPPKPQGGDRGWIESEPGIRLAYRPYDPSLPPELRLVVLRREGTAIAVDLRGFGETAPEGKAQPFGADWKEAFVAFHLNRPLLIQRTWDLRSMNATLGRRFAVTAAGKAVPAALHAAALEKVIPELTLEGGIVSWASVLRSPVTTLELSNVIPGALAGYDLPDLAALMAPRKLSILSPVDGAGRPVSQADLEAAYAGAREAYKAAGASDNLVLRAAP